jgi:micrococcal nuclease
VGCANGEATDAALGRTGRVRVIRVTDGDTFHVLRGGREVTIRLIGIDTPEVGWYGGKAECYGAAAGRFLRRRIGGERVRLEFDQERLDPYDRTLAYAHHEGKMLNVHLVRRGYARVTIYEPNDRYERRLRRAQRVAREERGGLWSACG